MKSRGGGQTVSEPIQHINARIGKMTYQLTTSDDPQKMRDIAVTADAMMAKIAKRQPNLNQVSLAVLALVNAVGMMEESHDKLQITLSERDFAKQTNEEIRAELIRLREQFWQLKKELLYYQNLCDIYEMKLADRLSGGDEDDQSARRYRRSRRTEMGDYQLTIEDALVNEPQDVQPTDEDSVLSSVEQTDSDV